MKLLKIFTLMSMTAAQEDGPGLEDTRGADVTAEFLATRIARVEEKCSFFMSKALTCVPPEEKQSKYNFRISKVLNDVMWHREVGKCLAKSADADMITYRRRRDDDSTEEDPELASSEEEFNAIYADQKNVRASEIPIKTLDRLESVCRKFVDAFFEIDTLKDCGKFGAWKRRADHLLDDMTAMKNICLKFRLDGSAGY